jgi:hypothetical protein
MSSSGGSFGSLSGIALLHGTCRVDIVGEHRAATSLLVCP